MLRFQDSLNSGHHQISHATRRDVENIYQLELLEQTANCLYVFDSFFIMKITGFALV